MRKAISLVLVFAMVFVILAGCGIPNIGARNTQNSVSGGKASDSYETYFKAKESAYKRLSEKMEGNDELAMASLSLLPIVMVDLTLIPLTIVSSPEGAAALAILGYAGINVTGSGNDYTITYSSTENDQKKTVTQTCKYDPASDSMQSKITDDDGKETMFFEYVKVGGGYASQYYFDNENGTYMQIKSFFNDTDTVAFGMETASAEPASILGNTSLTADFVKGGESYFILQGDALAVYENGAEKTY